MSECQNSDLCGDLCFVTLAPSEHKVNEFIAVIFSRGFAQILLFDSQ